VHGWAERAVQNGAVHISAKAEYAVRALLVMAADPDNKPIPGEAIARSQNMPMKFVENTLVELRRTGLVQSQRGAAGGFRLGRPANRITIADVVRAVDGPLAEVRGDRPENAVYEGPAEHLQTVWVATRAALRSVLEHVTLADVVNGRIPKKILKLTEAPDAWKPH
jgi:Rrf2 family protein